MNARREWMNKQSHTSQVRSQVLAAYGEIDVLLTKSALYCRFCRLQLLVLFIKRDLDNILSLKVDYFEFQSFQSSFCIPSLCVLFLSACMLCTSIRSLSLKLTECYKCNRGKFTTWSKRNFAWVRAKWSLSKDLLDHLEGQFLKLKPNNIILKISM